MSESIELNPEIENPMSSISVVDHDDGTMVLSVIDHSYDAGVLLNDYSTDDLIVIIRKIQGHIDSRGKS